MNLTSQVQTELWKYVDDTTTSETVNRTVLRICFATNNIPTFDAIIINNKPIDIVTDAKILGLKVSCNVKWNDHTESVNCKESVETAVQVIST